MDSGTLTNVLAIAVPIGTGLAFVAYAHPKNYVKLWKIISPVSSLAFCLMMIYNTGVSEGALVMRQLASKAIDDPKIALKLFDLDASEVASFNWTFIFTPIALWFYACALLALPQLGITKDISRG